MIEVFKPIRDYPDYEVSNLGRVRSLKFGKEKVLNPVIDKDGYLRVNFWQNGEHKQCFIHRLVAQEFIPNPSNLPQINHIDEDKTNNCVDNLEWCTAQYNNNYGTRNKKVAEKLSRQVGQYSLDGKLIFTWKSLMELYRFSKYNSGNISKCCRGLLPSAYGYKWKYI